MPPLARPASILLFALSLSVVPALAADETVTVTAADPAMAAAVETARSHLARVLDTAIASDGTAHPALTLKVAFAVDDGEEIIWVATVVRDGAEFTATLANEPLRLEGLAAGDTVRFTEAMIADWGLVGASGKLFGHYTTRVLLDTMPEAEAAPIRALLSDNPLPASWR